MLDCNDDSSSNSLLVNLSFLMVKPTGISTYAINLIPYLKPLHPTLLVARNYTDFSCYPVPPTFTPERGTKGHFQRLLWTQLKLPQIYHQLRSCLLFSPLPEAPIFTNCRYIVTVHDLIPLRFPRRNSPLTLYHRYGVPQVLARAQHILCDSVATAKDITDFCNIPASKITPVLLAHDRNHFRPLDLPSKGAALPCPYFLYIGRHDPYKNLHRLIDAFAAMPSRRDCQLWIAGPPDPRYTPLLQTQTKELGISDRVKFLDYLPYDKLPIMINQAIALVFPTLWEGFGLPVLEAMACGTPAITSNLSSLPEVTSDAALLVDPYNTGEITAAMQAMVTDGEMRSRFSTLGLNRASQFSWAKTGQATIDVLNQYL